MRAAIGADADGCGAISEDRLRIIGEVQGCGSDGSTQVSGDLRIDNRDECLAALHLPNSTEPSDATLVARMWARWGERCLPQIIGDFAMVVWDGSILWLVRAVPTSKLLVYRADADGCHFASVPAAIRAVHDQGPDLQYLANIVAGATEDAARTPYLGISKVPPGHFVRVQPGRICVVRWWDPPSVESSGSAQDHAEVLAGELGRSVAALANRETGALGSQLSAGRDSSAVTAIAGEHALRRNETLHAYTAAPDAAFAAEGVAGRIADESAIAAATAAIHPAIRHHVVRPPAPFDFAFLDEVHRLQQLPLSQVSNLPWWNAVLAAASGDGVSILLTGQVGNMTISAGGASYLNDVLQEEGVVAWARLAHRFAGASWPAWRGLLHGAIGPRLPRASYEAIMNLARPRSASIAPDLLRRPCSSPIAAVKERASMQAARRANLFCQDNYDALPMTKWGVELRDPTSDRRVVETCIKISSRFLIGAREERPIYDRIFSGRVAAEVLRPSARGYQGADWPIQFPRGAVAEAFDRYAAHDAVQQLFDVERVRRQIANWPAGRWTDYAVVDRYRLRLLTAVSVASFLSVTF